ncbi:monofunctional biosynthetic peptidoglycan transglycosylase [Primorskyibacter sp. S87]|uniref:monofunctional biosynthetic peptidoglycan transglycosylase n=1 Tax=Primorskyibacter sp. S87 TaxID=3415126 RepID=UPI003C7B7878
MARKTAGKSTKKKGKAKRKFKPLAWAGFILLRACTVLIVVVLALVILFRFVNPPVTATIFSEWRRLGSVEREWVRIEDIAAVAPRSVVAAEDANFCLHWGFDVKAIRAAIDAGAKRGASTLSQQVTKNVFLWQGRSWIRKALETAITPAVEAFWPKKRILEVYLNVAEMDEGVFGIQAAAQSYFGVDADQLTAVQSARIAAVLPNPKGRSAANPSQRLRRKAAAIMDGAATIRADGRSGCFED